MILCVYTIYTGIFTVTQTLQRFKNIQAIPAIRKGDKYLFREN